MNNEIFELVYDTQAYDEDEINDLADVLRKAGINVKIYVHLRESLTPPSLLTISLTVAAFYAFFKGFFAEAGKDTWRFFKEKVIKTLLRTKKQDIPCLEIRLKGSGLEIITAFKSDKEKEIIDFIDKSIPALLEVTGSSKEEDFPKEMEYIHLKYNSDSGNFECEGIKWLPSEERFIYSFKIKKWQKRS